MAFDVSAFDTAIQEPVEEAATQRSRAPREDGLFYILSKDPDVFEKIDQLFDANAERGEERYSSKFLRRVANALLKAGVANKNGKLPLPALAEAIRRHRPQDGVKPVKARANKSAVTTETPTQVETVPADEASHYLSQFGDADSHSQALVEQELVMSELEEHMPAAAE